MADNETYIEVVGQGMNRREIVRKGVNPNKQASSNDVVKNNRDNRDKIYKDIASKVTDPKALGKVNEIMTRLDHAKDQKERDAIWKDAERFAKNKYQIGTKDKPATVYDKIKELDQASGAVHAAKKVSGDKSVQLPLYYDANAANKIKAKEAQGSIQTPQPIQPVPSNGNSSPRASMPSKTASVNMPLQQNTQNNNVASKKKTPLTHPKEKKSLPLGYRQHINVGMGKIFMKE